jgi:NADH-quinone oxidoreductase subunit C
MTAEERQDALATLFAEQFGVEDLDAANGGPMIPAERHRELAKALKAAGYTFYVYVVATHFLATTPRKGDPLPERIEVATGLRSVGAGSLVAQWRVQVAIDEPIDTLADVFFGADWQEREQFDLVGVIFKDHPDLRRIMLPEEWVGHPLRKDYAIETGHLPWR